jgi:hypothetical protein
MAEEEQKKSKVKKKQIRKRGKIAIFIPTTNLFFLQCGCFLVIGKKILIEKNNIKIKKIREKR